MKVAKKRVVELPLEDLDGISDLESVLDFLRQQPSPSRAPIEAPLQAKSGTSGTKTGARTTRSARKKATTQSHDPEIEESINQPIDLEDLASEAPLVAAPTKKPLVAVRRDEHSNITAYFHEMSRERVMTPAEEVELSKLVVDSEVAHWAEVLSYPLTRLPILRALEQRLEHASEGASHDGEAEESEPGPVVKRKVASLPLAAVRKMIRHPERVPELVSKMAESVRLVDADREWIAEARGIALEVLGEGEKGTAARAYLERIERTRRVVVDLKNRFVRANLRYAVSIARRYNRGKMPLQDLIQEANIGLMRAVDRFDPDRGFRFTTYASWWIRHALTRSIADTSRTIRLPVHIQDVALKVNRLASVFVTSYGREPTVEELAAESGLSVEKVTRIRTIGTGTTMSLDRPIGEDPEGSTFVDMLTDESVKSAHDRVESEEIQKLVADAVAKLPARFASVLRLRFGIGTDDDQTLRQIGDLMGVSRERIRQIEAQALRLLRDILRDRETPKDKERRLRVLRRLQLPRDVARDRAMASMAPITLPPITTHSTFGALADLAPVQTPPARRRKPVAAPPSALPLPEDVPVTIPRRNTPLVRPRAQSSFVVYRGPSAFDGSKIVAIVSNVSRDPSNGASSNEKLGHMAQLHILVADEAPNLAKTAGRDAAVCGDCDLRTAKKGIACYVHVAFSTTTLWKAHAWRPIEIEACAKALADEKMHLRLGAYGDPAALPESLIETLVKASAGATGYTHDWRKARSDWLKKYAMASVENEVSLMRAQGLGWRTYRIVGSAHAQLDAGEIICPSVTNGTHCEACRLCDGARSEGDDRKDIAIPVHGHKVALGKKTEAKRVDPEAPCTCWMAQQGQAHRAKSCPVARIATSR